MFKPVTKIIPAVALLAPFFTFADAPQLKSATPVVYLAHNLDEQDQLGWCIDTDGRGFAEKLQAHSCKPAGKSAKDTQFSYNTETGKIRSAAYPEFCMTFSDPDSLEWPFTLIKCATGNKLQRFTYDPASMEILIGNDESKCVVVAENSISAGPFMSRDLIYANCASIKNKFKQWVVKPHNPTDS